MLNVRRAVAGVLLLFAAGAIVFMLRDVAARPSPPDPQGADVAARPDRVDAYYFHGNARCATCRKLEAYGLRALRSGFAGALDEGRLVWRPTNVDLPENRHFIQDFELRFRSLVLVEVRDGQPGRWVNLERIWALAGDADACVAYVEAETGRFMGGR